MLYSWQEQSINIKAGGGERFGCLKQGIRFTLRCSMLHVEVTFELGLKTGHAFHSGDKEERTM